MRQTATWAFGLFLAFCCSLGPAATAKPLDVEVGYLPILATTPLLIIAHEGWDKEADLALHLTRFEAGTAAIQAMASGKLDMLYAGIGPILVARANGVDVTVIANSAIQELALVARGPLATASRGVDVRTAMAQTVKQLGRKVKIAAQPAGSVPDTVLRYWLQKVVAIPDDQVELIGMGIEKTQQALMAGAVDAAMVREPVITVVHDLDAQSVVLAQGGDMFPGQPGTVVAASGRFLKAHPEAAVALVRLHLRATQMIAEDKPRAARAAQEFIGKGLIDPAVTERALAAPSSHFLADPRAIVEATARMQAFQKDLGTIERTAPIETLFDFSYYDAAAAGR